MLLSNHISFNFSTSLLILILGAAPFNNLLASKEDMEDIQKEPPSITKIRKKRKGPELKKPKAKRVKQTPQMQNEDKLSNSPSQTPLQKRKAGSDRGRNDEGKRTKSSSQVPAHKTSFNQRRISEILGKIKENYNFTLSIELKEEHFVEVRKYYERNQKAIKNDPCVFLRLLKVIFGPHISFDIMNPLYRYLEDKAHKGVLKPWEYMALGKGYEGGWMAYSDLKAQAPNREKALVYYQKAADQDYAPAQEALAWFYDIGEKPAKVISLLRRASDQGLADASRSLAEFYEKGWTESCNQKKQPPKPEKAVAYYKRAIEQSRDDPFTRSTSLMSLVHLYKKGWIKSDGTKQKPDWDKAKTLLEKSGRFLELGKMYKKGWVRSDGSKQKPDVEKVIKYYTLSYKSGARDMKLFRLLEKCWVPLYDRKYLLKIPNKDGSTLPAFAPRYGAPLKVMEAYRALAGTIDEHVALFGLGSMYDRGWVNSDGSREEPNDEKAFDSYVAAAKKGDPNAVDNLLYKFRVNNYSPLIEDGGLISLDEMYDRGFVNVGSRQEPNNEVKVLHSHAAHMMSGGDPHIVDTILWQFEKNPLINYSPGQTNLSKVRAKLDSSGQTNLLEVRTKLQKSVAVIGYYKGATDPEKPYNTLSRSPTLFKIFNAILVDLNRLVNIVAYMMKKPLGLLITNATPRFDILKCNPSTFVGYWNFKGKNYLSVGTENNKKSEYLLKLLAKLKNYSLLDICISGMTELVDKDKDSNREKSVKQLREVRKELARIVSVIDGYICNPLERNEAFRELLDRRAAWDSYNKRNNEW